jgi:hypothetical protein
MTKESYLAKAIKWAKRKGFSDIKAVHEDFEEPTHYRRPELDKPFVPDVTGRKRGVKSYIEVATKEDNPERSISKWNLLSTLASLKGGKLYLLAPKGNKAFVERVIKRYSLTADLIYLPNV